MQNPFNPKSFGLGLLVLVALGGFWRAQAVSASQYVVAGDKAFEDKDYTKAIHYYRKALQENSRSADAYEGLGNAYYALGAKTDALSAYENSLQYNPENPRVLDLVKGLKPSREKEYPDAEASPTPEVEFTPIPEKPWPTNIVGQVALMGGLELTNANTGVTLGSAGDFPQNRNGLGGGFRFGAMAGSNVFVGGNIAIYNFGTPADTSQGNYFASSTYHVNLQSLEFTALVEYRFSNSHVRPYLLLGGGFSEVGASLTNNTSYIVIFGSSQNLATSSTLSPMWEAGAGMEFRLSGGTNLFFESRYEMIYGNGGQLSYNGYNFYLVNGSIFSHVPIELGLSFNIF